MAFLFGVWHFESIIFGSNNNVTRNREMFAGCSEISLRVLAICICTSF